MNTLTESSVRLFASPQGWIEGEAVRQLYSRFSGISVERYTPVFQTGIEGALPSCPSIFRDANTGAGQVHHCLAAAVQLRLRIAFGLQALK
jgi:hypothetical protein